MVTGGGSGIGKGVAAAVVAAGGKAMLVGRNVDRLSGAADEIEAQAGDGNVLYEPADVTNEEESPAWWRLPPRGPGGCTAWCTAPGAARRSARLRRSTPTHGDARST